MTKRLVSLAFYTNQHGNVTSKFKGNNSIISMASDRMQFRPALQAAELAGLSTEVYSLHGTAPHDVISLGKADICLVSKMSANTKDLVQSMVVANLAALTLLKNEGAKIVVQHCDNLLSQDNTFNKRSDLNRFYKCLLSMADAIIFPCNELAKITDKQITSKASRTIICDPWQLKKPHPTKPLNLNKRCKIIWFGNTKNIIYLIKCMENIVNTSPKHLNYLLTVVSSAESRRMMLAHLKSIKFTNSNWRVKFIIWDEKFKISQLEDEISKANISIIPSDPNDPIKSGVSHNRLVDSVRGGCITLASPMESYKELDELALLGDDFGKLLSKAIADYEHLCVKLEDHRDQRLSIFSPEYNLESWKSFWSDLMK